MSNSLENFDDVLKAVNFITKYAILAGIILCLLSITFAIYNLLKLKKGKNLQEIKYAINIFVAGVIVSFSGILTNFIANYDTNFTSYKYEIPIWYVISLIAFLLFINGYKRNSDSKDKVEVLKK